MQLAVHRQQLRHVYHVQYTEYSQSFIEQYYSGFGAIKSCTYLGNQSVSDQIVGELSWRQYGDVSVVLAVVFSYHRNLAETTRSVYKENLALSEHLSEVMKREEMLKQINHQLKEENSLLVAESENTSVLISEKETEEKRSNTKLGEVAHHHSQLIQFIENLRSAFLCFLCSQVEEKISLLETALNHMIREFNTERRQLLSECDQLHAETRQSILHLQQQVTEKTKECTRVRKLAKKILTDRNNIERFFLESIELVRLQIDYNR